MKKVLLTISILSFIGAFIIIAPLVYYSRKNTAALTTRTPQIISSTPVVVAPEAIHGKPVKLVIDKLGISVPVVDGTYNAQNGTWTLSFSNAHFATMTSEPNNLSGNTLIYGHYRPEVFSKLKHVQSGQIAEVYTNNGYVFTYSFVTSTSVSPTDTTIFSYSGAPQLTVQTCSGAFLQNRQLFTFSYTGYHQVDGAVATL